MGSALRPLCALWGACRQGGRKADSFLRAPGISSPMRRNPYLGQQGALQVGSQEGLPRVVDGRKKLSRSLVQRQAYQNFISRENGNPDDGIMTSDHNQSWGRTCLLVTGFISFLCSTELSVFFQRCLKGPDWILVFLLNVFCWFVLWNWVRVLMDCSLLFYASGKWLI